MPGLMLCDQGFQVFQEAGPKPGSHEDHSQVVIGFHGIRIAVLPGEKIQFKKFPAWSAPPPLAYGETAEPIPGGREVGEDYKYAGRKFGKKKETNIYLIMLTPDLQN